MIARVQSHPSRRQLRQRLLVNLTGFDTVEVVETDFYPPNPWMGYRECLISLVDSGAEHGLIVQDDTLACRNLAPALERIAEVIPDAPVCLYLGMLPPQQKPALEAAKRGECFVELVPRSFLPIVAVLWPRAKAEHFLTWAEPRQQIRRGNGVLMTHRSDDAVGGLWMKGTRQRVFATIPSLIQHPDDVPSTIALRPARRTALFWHGEDWDALSVDWRI